MRVSLVEVTWRSFLLLLRNRNRQHDRPRSAWNDKPKLNLQTITRVGTPAFKGKRYGQSQRLKGCAPQSRDRFGVLDYLPLRSSPTFDRG